MGRAQKQPLKKKREVPTYLIYHLPDVMYVAFGFFFFGALRWDQHSTQAPEHGSPSGIKALSADMHAHRAFS
jgi:hypothetical protein